MPELVTEAGSELFLRWQQTTLIVIPYITGPISLGSSSLVAFLIAREWKYKKRFLYHRMLLAMSLCDMLGSINVTLSGLVIPRHYNRFASRGNIKTCEASGFLLQFSVVLPLLNMFLCIYYVRTVCFGWNPPTTFSLTSTQGRKRLNQAWLFELTAYVMAILYPLAMGGVALHYDSFNPMVTLPGWCYFSEMPYDCNKFDNVDCIRGQNYSFIQSFASTIPLGCAVIVGITCVTMVSRRVRQQHQLLARRYGFSEHSNLHDESGDDTDNQRRPAIFSSSFFLRDNTHPGGTRGGNINSRRRNSGVNAINVGNAQRLKQTAEQARLYTAAFLISYVVPIMQAFTGAFLEAVPRHRTFFFVSGILITVLTPLQGFWNLLIYLRPRYQTARYLHPDKSNLKLLIFILSTPVTATGSRGGRGRGVLLSRNQNQAQPAVWQHYQHQQEEATTGTTPQRDLGAFEEQKRASPDPPPTSQLEFQRLFVEPSEYEEEIVFVSSSSNNDDSEEIESNNEQEESYSRTENQGQEAPVPTTSLEVNAGTSISSSNAPVFDSPSTVISA